MTKKQAIKGWYDPLFHKKMKQKAVAEGLTLLGLQREIVKSDDPVKNILSSSKKGGKLDDFYI